MVPLQRCLRPVLHIRSSRPCTPAVATSYIRFYSIAHGLATVEADADIKIQREQSPVQARTEALQCSGQELYPRFPRDAAVKTWTCRSFADRYGSLAKDETINNVTISLNAQILRFKSKIITRIRDFLQGNGYLELQTPILANFAGGAVARPFETHAVEFLDRHIELRTAPELWLKRLVLGGFESIFEIGPCFRNEGIDKIHNPEFTTCEFYAAYTSLKELMSITERLLTDLITFTNDTNEKQFNSLPLCTISLNAPFRRLDFIKELELAMSVTFPDLRSPEAEAEVIQMFHQRGLRLPDFKTLPRLLDRLSSKFLEPRCQDPTWIVHHPECLSPLSKSFVDPDTKQRLAARAELFIGGKEVVNTYEEENSPFEQRRKFEEQVKYRNDDNKADIDESYLEALEWGLPPTGGWGCGIDRLVMLLSGTDRINDVLPFGNLRNVVALGKGGRDVIKP
ncbi:MAG: hypothetical protein Q9166_002403 [cf. Caloplaca sp. 2 TL-2023]